MADDERAIARRLEAFAARHATERDREPADRPEAILDRAAVRIFDAFAAAGVGAILLKGAALARTLYEPHERRPYVDIDILVAPTDREPAGVALAHLGYYNASANRGIDEIGAAVVHDELWLGRAHDTTYPLQVELHRWLPGARAEPDVVWGALRGDLVEMPLGSGVVPVLGRAGQAVHLATHAAQHGPAYAKGLRELSLALERWPADVWQDAGRLAEQIDAAEAFAVGLRLVPPGAALAARLGLPVSARLAWNVEHQDERPRGAFHFDALRKAPGVSAKVMVLRRALIPDRRWMAYEYPWARGPIGLLAAYVLHVMRAPLWAARAWRFRRRARRLSS